MYTELPGQIRLVKLVLSVCDFHVLSNLLLNCICKLHWNQVMLRRCVPKIQLQVWGARQRNSYASAVRFFGRMLTLASLLFSPLLSSSLLSASVLQGSADSADLRRQRVRGGGRLDVSLSRLGAHCHSHLPLTRTKLTLMNHPV